jgi:beta-1,2-mannobiose phosphorylase / 1,2-beta-oligomannan phosphorylase
MLRRTFLASSAVSLLYKALPAALIPPSSPGSDTKGGWRKYEQNPVLGGSLGVCFDVSLLREEGKYRMWFSWRTRKSIAWVESSDGIHWGPPVIVLSPNPASGWEENINRPVVIRKGDTYLMWYTGQARGHSSIGLATSADGIRWERAAGAPVLSASEPWEKVAVMCPSVLWEASAGLYRVWYSGG